MPGKIRTGKRNFVCKFVVSIAGLLLDVVLNTIVFCVLEFWDLILNNLPILNRPKVSVTGHRSHCLIRSWCKTCIIANYIWEFFSFLSLLSGEERRLYRVSYTRNATFVVSYWDLERFCFRHLWNPSEDCPSFA